MPDHHIEIRAVSKNYSGTPVLHDVSLEVRRGELLVLLGSSGSGKSTLLKTINGLVIPSEGDVSYEGKRVADHDVIALRRSIGYVFQQVGLFPHLSVLDNISLVSRLNGMTRPDYTKAADMALEQVSLDPERIRNRFPAELSGGEQQRVGVARALVTNPHCILMDEPFGAVDAITRDGLQQEVQKLQQDGSRTIVFVTHDLFEALTLADRIAVLHQGKLEQVGTPREVMTKPASQFVSDLFARPFHQLRELEQARL